MGVGVAGIIININNYYGPFPDSLRLAPVDVLFPLVGLIEGCVQTPNYNRQRMIDGIPNRPLYFHQKDIIGYHNTVYNDSVKINSVALLYKG